VRADIRKQATRRSWLVALTVVFALNTVALAANVTNESAAPNPFDPNLGETATISYDLANDALLWLKIYDGGDTLQRNLVTPGSFTTPNRTTGGGLKWLIVCPRPAGDDQPRAEAGQQPGQCRGIADHCR